MLLEMFVTPSVGGERLEPQCLAELASDIGHGWSGGDWLLLIEELLIRGHSEIHGVRFDRNVGK